MEQALKHLDDWLWD